MARATPSSRGRARDRASSQFPAGRAHSDITVRGTFYMAYGGRSQNLSPAKGLGPLVYRAWKPLYTRNPLRSQGVRTLMYKNLSFIVLKN